MRLLLAALALAVGLQAQSVNNNRYFVSIATTKLTVQQPASNALQVRLGIAEITCVAAQTLTERWNGAAATATAATIVKGYGTLAQPVATAYSGSNVGNGTTGPTHSLAAGVPFLLDLREIVLGTTGTTANYTLATDGACTITFPWTEYPQ